MRPDMTGRRHRRKRTRGGRGGRGQGRRYPTGGTSQGHSRGGGLAPLPEENVDLSVFHLEFVHLLLQKVYGDFPHHNGGLHLDGGIMDNNVWQCRWRRLAAHSGSWYATPSGAVGRRFTEILATEWWGLSVGVGTLRDLLSLPTLSSRRHWASAGPKRSRHG